MDSFCKDYFPSARKITGVKLAEDKIAIQEAGNVGAITVATNAAGRGIDIELHPQTLKNGGLHVIIPFMPENARILEQAMGRSARQRQPGTVSLYVSRGDCFFSTPKFQKIERIDLHQFISFGKQQIGNSSLPTMRSTKAAPGLPK